jgi:hypothetical protein
MWRGKAIYRPHFTDRQEPSGIEKRDSQQDSARMPVLLTNQVEMETNISAKPYLEKIIKP